ncbi:MAG: ABC transporter permease [Polyangiaceae bacterium]|nr:ABC transporter permease [Polyangiaceae bacterium]
MTPGALALLVRRELSRSGGALATAGFGILAGTFALAFFVALGLGARAVLLGDVFPLDRVELEPEARPEPGLLALLTGRGKAPPGIAPEAVERLSRHPGVAAAYPKLKFAFPSGAFGGKEIIGRDVGTHEMLADGVAPALVAPDIKGPTPFEDPLARGGAACSVDSDCASSEYCELPSDAARGQCSAPVPVIVSPYLVEIFNKGIAPAHGLPQLGMTLVTRAQGVTFRLQLGVSMMGAAKRGKSRDVKARLVGVSRSALDLGATLPLPVVERWNREYFGPEAATRPSSLLLRTKTAADVASVVQAGAAEGLVARDSRARDVSVLVTSTIALLSLVAGTMLVVGATNIAHTFRMLVSERRREIGLYRALGATPGDIRAWVLALAVAVGVAGGLAGVGLARVAAWLVDLLAATHLPDFPFKPASFFLFPAWLVVGAAAFGVGFAVTGALFAVRRAVKIDPMEALGSG